MRVAALWVPNFPLQALVRSFPELAEVPVVVAVGPRPQDGLLAVSPEAQELGVHPSMTAAQARQVAGAIQVKTLPDAIQETATGCLADVARSFSPQVKVVGPGLVWLEVGGLKGRWSEEELARQLWQRGFRVGLKVHVGVANGGEVATVAARMGETVVIPPGKEAEFLAPLPLGLTKLSPSCRQTLAMWGIATFGALAALPRGEVVRRLSREGLQLHRLAQGEEEGFIPDAPEEEFRESVWLEQPVVNIEACLFVLRGLFSRLRERLALRGQGFAQARVELALEDKGKREYTLPLLAPTEEVPALLALTRILLEASPPGGAVEGAVVEAQGGAVPSWQESLFAPPRPHPGSLAAALVRLAAIVGAEGVGSPELLNSHRPNAWKLIPFALSWERQPLPASQRHERRPVLRLWQPPRPAQVTMVGGKPLAVRSAEVAGLVKAWAGPYRWEGEWWTEEPFARDDYDVCLASGFTLRIFFDRQRKRWFVGGVYD